MKSAMDQVRADKEREASDGHDGTWVAHPGLVPSPRKFSIADAEAESDRPETRGCPYHRRGSARSAPGQITEAGLRQNIAVGIGYLESWFRGIGCVPLFNLMEDAATAEISRAQLWQWVHHKAHLEDGRLVDVNSATRSSTKS